MSQFNQEYYTNGISNRQQFDQMEQAFYNYCSVMRSPKLGAAPVVIVGFTGLLAILLFVALGESLLTALAISAPICAVLAFLFWLAYRYTLLQTVGWDYSATLPWRSPLRPTSSGLADIICLSKTELCSGVTALPI